MTCFNGANAFPAEFVCLMLPVFVSWLGILKADIQPA